jgi:hypothetical protein
MDLTGRTALALVAFAAVATSCGGARHRKVAGPPPEYEQPEQLDAWVPSAGGPDAAPAPSRPARDAGAQ